MKNNLIIFSALFVMLFATACTKNTQKPTTDTTTNVSSKTVTLQQSLAGKWYFIKDSVKATDTYTPIQFLQKQSFNKGDYIVFNNNNTGSLSTNVSYDALETNYVKLYINPNAGPIIPTLKFNYQLSSDDSTVLVSNLVESYNRGYVISHINATSMVLTTYTEIPKYPHDYRFVQQLYFSK